jgi:hypothetical protein
VIADEAVPRRDDACRIAPHDPHVGEVHPVGARAERLAQKLELTLPHHHQDRLVPPQTVLDEGTRALDELVIARIKTAS